MFTLVGQRSKKKKYDGINGATMSNSETKAESQSI